jgi:hypothetical protein
VIVKRERIKLTVLTDRTSLRHYFGTFRKLSQAFASFRKAQHRRTNVIYPPANVGNIAARSRFSRFSAQATQLFLYKSLKASIAMLQQPDGS